MADFVKAFDKMQENEGGYILHDVPGDTGGMTYAGIARKKNPDWSGWKDIDAGILPDAPEVREFYKPRYWDIFKGDELLHQDVAESIFDFGVNAGVTTSVKLAQIVAGVQPDARVGPKTLDAWNAIDPVLFKLHFAIAKITRYAEICNRDRSQSKFLLGWLNRTLKGLK